MANRPRVFVGSAAEHKRVLERLRLLNDHARIRFIPWTNLGVFPSGAYTLESLMRVFHDVDGAAFLSIATDKTWWRGNPVDTPRDNVLLEAGISLGTFGPRGTAFVSDRITKLPSDLAGIQTIPFQPSGDENDDASELSSALESHFSFLSETRRLVRQIWSSRAYRIYFHSYDNPEKGEFEEIVNVNAVRAVSHLTEYFGHESIGYELCSSRLTDLSMDGDVVLLGSSASNRLTRRIEEEKGRTVPFSCSFDRSSMKNRVITSRDPAKTFRPLFKGKRLIEDYGILTKMPNPYSKDSWLVMAAGNYGFGTLGAIQFSLQPSLLAELPFSPRGAFQAVVKVPVLGPFSLGRPTLMCAVELSA